MSFASPANACYRQEPLRAIELRYQERHCLNANHADCPLFQDADASLPPGVISIKRPWYRRFFR